MGEAWGVAMAKGVTRRVARAAIEARIVRWVVEMIAIKGD